MKAYWVSLAMLMILGGPASSQADLFVNIGDLEADSIQGEIVPNRNAKGGELNIGGLPYKSGLGVRAKSEVVCSLDGTYDRFEAWVGPDMQSGKGQITFKVFCDGVLSFDSGPIAFAAWEHNTNPNRAVRVFLPLSGVRELRLVTEASSDEILGDWAEARFARPGAPEYAPRPAPADRSLAPGPPMGFNSWNAFGTKINGKLIRQVADAMVEKGLKDAGYVLLCLDDGWQGATGDSWNAESFPGGMKPLGDYIHGKGMKFGIYSRPAWVKDEERKVARAFADWGVDYLKYDFSDRKARESNRKMIDAVRATGRPVVFNVCEWGKNRPWEWASAIGAQTWRATYDVIDRWHYTDLDRNWGLGILKAADQTEALGPFSGPGRWNDPDMLVVGCGGEAFMKGGGCTPDEYRSQFSLWCLLSAPLFIGCDVRILEGHGLETLLNREAIALDQDPLGVPAWRVRKLGPLEVWKKPLHDGSLAVGLLNRSEERAPLSVTWADLGIAGTHGVRDIWAGTDTRADGRIEREAASHELVLLRLTPLEGED